jgi:hypothetical protein
MPKSGIYIYQITDSVSADMESRNELKDKIRKKFKTIKRFALLTGEDPTFLTEQLRGGRKMSLDAVTWFSAIVDNLDDKVIASIEMTSELRDKIRQAILQRNETIKAFCEENGYIETWMQRVIGGSQFSITRKTKKIVELIKFLEIEE